MTPNTTKAVFRRWKNTFVIWAVFGVPLGAAAARIYVANRGGTTVSVIDTSTNKVVQTLGNLESPETVRFSPDGKRLYIVVRSEDNLIVMDRESGKTIKKVPLSGWANDMLATSDGKLVVIAIRNTGVQGEDAGALDIVDARSLEKIKSIPWRRGLHDPALTADNKYVAAGSPGGRSLIVFDLTSREIAWELQFDQGVQPLTMESNPDGTGRRIFLQLSGTNGFAVVDFATHKEIERIKYPDEPKQRFNGMRACEGISHGIGIAPDSKSLWSVSKTADVVFAYSLPELKLLGYVALPEVSLPEGGARSSGPAWVTFTPDSRTVYVSTCGTKSVSAINAKEMKEITRIPVGEMPDRISTLDLR